MSNFKDSIYSGNSFIYQIEDKWYCIGTNTFTELTNSDETDLYELLQNAIKKNNERQIRKYLEKMARITVSYRVDSKEHLRTKERLIAFLDNLEKNNIKEYENLQKQYLVYTEMFEKYHPEQA